MGNQDKQTTLDFINSIPDDKLKDLPTSATTGIFETLSFRLDMQGMTSDKPARHNLQVQINNQAKSSTIRNTKNAQGATCAGPVLVPQGNTMEPADIRTALIAKASKFEANTKVNGQPKSGFPWDAKKNKK